MADHVIQPIDSAGSDSDVQEIDPPVVLRSTRKRRRRKILRESIDCRFCRCSLRNKKRNEDSTAESSLHTILTSSSDRKQAGYSLYTCYTMYCPFVPN
jgi:hypothetical protein